MPRRKGEGEEGREGGQREDRRSVGRGCDTRLRRGNETGTWLSAPAPPKWPLPPLLPPPPPKTIPPRGHRPPCSMPGRLWGRRTCPSSGNFGARASRLELRRGPGGEGGRRKG